MIKGYRELNADEIAVMNNAKGQEADILAFLEEMSKEFDVDQRWLAIGRTHIQQGFMAVIRAITKPE